jgi:general secretion pathway protein L
VIVPSALLGVAILAALVLPVWQKREEAIALNQQSDLARQRAGVSDALRTELERKIGEYNFALERKYGFPGTVQVLDDITHLLPDDTWITQLELRSVRGKDGQRELTLRGESANAGRLVSLLEDSKLFTQAAPRSPTTKIQPGPGEIFDVGAQLKPTPPPQAAPLDLTAPPPPPVVPQRPRAALPATTPAATPNAAPSATTPGAVPQTAPGAAPQTTPGAAPQTTPGNAPATAPANAPAAAPPATSSRRSVVPPRNAPPGSPPGAGAAVAPPPVPPAPAPPATAEPEPAEGEGNTQ